MGQMISPFNYTRFRELLDHRSAADALHYYSCYFRNRSIEGTLQEREKILKTLQGDYGFITTSARNGERIAATDQPPVDHFIEVLCHGIEFVQKIDRAEIKN